jgi:hypothetical protein
MYYVRATAGDPRPAEALYRGWGYITFRPYRRVQAEVFMFGDLDRHLTRDIKDADEDDTCATRADRRQLWMWRARGL